MKYVFILLLSVNAFAKTEAEVLQEGLKLPAVSSLRNSLETCLKRSKIKI